jgi:hypothetical protein
VGEELLSGSGIGFEHPSDRGSLGDGTRLLHSTRRHTHVATFNNHRCSSGFENFHNSLAHLRGKSFLNLKPPGKHFDDTRKFGEAQDLSIGDVTNVSDTVEGSKMMFAKGEDIDVGYDNHFVMVFLENGPSNNLKLTIDLLVTDVQTLPSNFGDEFAY